MFYFPLKRLALWFSFFVGLLYDLWTFGIPGVSSFFLLFYLLVLTAYSQKFNPAHPLFMALFSFASFLTWSKIQLGFFDKFSSFLWALILLIIFTVLRVVVKKNG